MKKTNAAVPYLIPFRSAELWLIEHQGSPFVPMKPLVEGMGLNWKTQRAKLAASHFAAQAIKIAVLTTTGNHRSMICIHLRKLLGWLMTISSENVPPKLRQSVHAYQDECDEVLWQHWMLGQPQRTKYACSNAQINELNNEHVDMLKRALAGDARLNSLVAEGVTATRLARLLLRDKRWLVTFNAVGDPQLISLPADAGVFTPERILNWIRENDGARPCFIPKLLHAIGDRLEIANRGIG